VLELSRFYYKPFEELSKPIKSDEDAEAKLISSNEIGYLI
jgi:hypothetical protein